MLRQGSRQSDVVGHVSCLSRARYAIWIRQLASGAKIRSVFFVERFLPCGDDATRVRFSSASSRSVGDRCVSYENVFLVRELRLSSGLLPCDLCRGTCPYVRFLYHRSRSDVSGMAASVFSLSLVDFYFLRFNSRSVARKYLFEVFPLRCEKNRGYSLDWKEKKYFWGEVNCLGPFCKEKKFSN